MVEILNKRLATKQIQPVILELPKIVIPKPGRGL